MAPAGRAHGRGGVLTDPDRSDAAGARTVVRRLDPLARRAAELTERMEDPTVPRETLRRTYAQFGTINDLVAGWRGIWREVLAPAARAAAAQGRPVRLLDVGSGGGDLIRRLCAWAAHDGIRLRATGVDPDPVATAVARARPVPPGARYLQARAEELERPEGGYDLIVSNHLLHHLPADAAADLFRTSDRLRGRDGVVAHGDLHRSAWALPAFWALSLPFRGSFVREDGFRSIRRAWRPEELAPLAPDGWTVRRLGPFRLLAGTDPTKAERIDAPRRDPSGGDRR